MKKERIFFKSLLRFLLPAVILQAAPAVSAAVFNREPLIISGESGTNLHDELLLLYRHLASIYHLVPRRSPVTLEIVLSPAIPAAAPEIKTDGGHWIAAINNDPVLFAGSTALRRRVFTAMLFAAAGIDIPVNRGLSPLPPAAFLGLDAIINGWHGPERWVRGNRRLNVLRALLEAKSLPETAQWLPEAAETPEYLSPAAYVWSRELARAAVESGSRLFFTRKRLAGYLTPEGGRDMDFITAAAGGTTNAAVKFRQQMVRLAWSEFNPRPAGVTLQELADWRLRTIDELDKEGKPTGKSSKMDIAAVIPLLHQRPDALKIISAAADSLQFLANGDSRDFKAAASATALQIMSLKDDGYPERSDSLLSRIDHLAAITRQRFILGQFLDKVAAENTPLSITHDIRFKTAGCKPQIISTEAAGFLDKIAAAF